MRAEGTPAAIVAVYGNRAYEDALLELRGLAEERGFKVMAAAAFIARHSIAPEFGAGRPDAADFLKMDEFVRRIRESWTMPPPRAACPRPSSPAISYSENTTACRCTRLPAG
ncbi:MAG: hypothetical protein ACLTSG_10865 [Lachnospiraceae bacterium]